MSGGKSNMRNRICGRALLFALLLLLAYCDGDQLQRGTVPEPEEGSTGDSPAWLAEARAQRLNAEKSKDKYAAANPPLPLPKRRADIVYEQQTPQDLLPKSPDLRVQRLPETPEKPLRGTVPTRAEKAAADAVEARIAADAAAKAAAVKAEVVDLQPAREREPGIAGESVPLRDNPNLRAIAAQRDALALRDAQLQRDALAQRDTALAEPVDLDAYTGRPLSQLISPRQETQPFDPAAPASTGGRLTVPATVRTVPGAPDPDTIGVAVDLPRPSRIENLYNSSFGLSRGRRLEQFGYKVFATGPRPEANVVPDAEFVLGPGDEIHIRSNALDLDKIFVVERDGTIFIDKNEIGTIKVAGLRYKDLLPTILAAVPPAIKNPQFKLDVTLGKLHSIRVQIYGYVKAPGIQSLGGNATLMDALLAAGGPTKDGTLRDIVVQRPGQVDTHVDLYGMIASGVSTADVVLLSGDRVFVGPIGPTAAVIGQSGSGIFEMLGKTPLASLMAFAGRINPFSQLNNVQVERTVNNQRREVQTVDYTRQAATFIVQDGDVVAFALINEVLSNTVIAAGAVVRPATYPFKEGMKVSDLIRMAGGFALDASLDRALIQRPLGDPAAFNIMIGDRAGSTREQNIRVDLAGILAGNKDADIPVRRLDTLKIFTNLDSRDDATVTIKGGVRKPGVYKLTAGLTLGDLIFMAGGPTQDASPGESSIVRLVRADSDTLTSVQNYKFRLDEVLRHLADYDLVLENRDQIVIKRTQNMQVTVRVVGRVQSPDTYILPDGAKISTLLAEAGGVLRDADLRAAVFTRKEIQKRQQARLDELFARMNQNFADKRNYVVGNGHNNEGIAAHLAYLGLGQLTSNIERFQARGRLVVNLMCDNFLGSNHDVVLEDGDELYIPRRQNYVMIMGQANSPSAFVWNRGSTVSDYLNQVRRPAPRSGQETNLRRHVEWRSLLRSEQESLRRKRLRIPAGAGRHDPDSEESAAAQQALDARGHHAAGPPDGRDRPDRRVDPADLQPEPSGHGGHRRRQQHPIAAGHHQQPGAGTVLQRRAGEDAAG